MRSFTLRLIVALEQLWYRVKRVLLLPVCAVMAAVEAAVVAEAPLLVAHGTTGAHSGGAGVGAYGGGVGADGGGAGADGGGEQARCCRAAAGFHDQHQNDAADSTEAPL